MIFKELDKNVSVAPQIQPGDIEAIVAAGFKSIICNRPDGEEHDQPAYSLIETAAKEAGLPICNIPVVSGRITRDNVADMKVALETMPKPVFAYCRSGARCTNLYAMVQDLID